METTTIIIGVLVVLLLAAVITIILLADLGAIAGSRKRGTDCSHFYGWKITHEFEDKCFWVKSNTNEFMLKLPVNIATIFHGLTRESTREFYLTIPVNFLSPRCRSGYGF